MPWNTRWPCEHCRGLARHLVFPPVFVGRTARKGRVVSTWNALRHSRVRPYIILEGTSRVNSSSLLDAHPKTPPTLWRSLGGWGAPPPQNPSSPHPTSQPSPLGGRHPCTELHEAHTKSENPGGRGVSWPTDQWAKKPSSSQNAHSENLILRRECDKGSE